MTRPIPVLYGTETGTAEMCAVDLASAMNQAGYVAYHKELDSYRASDLGDEPFVVVVTSTFGDGDAPANAEAFMEHLKTDRPPLPGMRFAVCALGDSSYPNFAQCGKDFDALFEQLGGDRVVSRVDCDGAPDIPFAGFQKQVLAYLRAHPDLHPPADGPTTAPTEPGLFARLTSWLFGSGEVAPAPAASRPTVEAPGAPEVAVIDRTHPGSATLLESRKLSGSGSTKDTRHHRIAIETGIDLHPGDSIGIYPTNDPDLVRSVVEAAGLTGDESVRWKGTDTVLETALAGACLQRVPMKLLETVEHGPAAAIRDQGQDAIEDYVETHHVLEVLRTSGDLDAQVLVDRLHPLTPRLYSVANVVEDGVVEVVVERTRYELGDWVVDGVASSWLADRCAEGTTVPWYPHPNLDFRLPDGDAPLILVGPGTGIAPFRGFLQQLERSGERRQTWLFFGHRHSASDDLYGDELAAHLQSGVLTKRSDAWSRDGSDKVYVQDRITEAADEIWDWLQQGAIVMVCGDAGGMSKGVRQAFSDIATRKGQDGAAWLSARIADDLYREDVY